MAVATKGSSATISGICHMNNPQPCSGQLATGQSCICRDTCLRFNASAKFCQRETNDSTCGYYEPSSERSLFENWVSMRRPHASLQRYTDGEYMWSVVQHYWVGWQLKAESLKDGKQEVSQ